jgi:FkbM family methyltransferase
LNTETGLNIDLLPGDEFLWRHASLGLLQFDGPLHTVLDIGAHVGCFALAAAQRGAERVYAVEPGYMNFIRLVKNIIQNGFWGTIIPLPCAVWTTHFELRALRKAGSNDGQQSLMFQERFPANKCITYDFHRLLSETVPLSYLKMDIEGAEWEVFLRGADNLQPLLSQVDYVDIETHQLGNEDYFTPPASRFKYNTKEEFYDFWYGEGDGNKLRALLSSSGFSKTDPYPLYGDMSAIGIPCGIRTRRS